MTSACISVLRRSRLLVLFAVLVPTLVIAQQSTDGPYVLHERVDDLRVGAGEGGGAEGQPTAPTIDSSQFEGAPPLSLEARPGEPVFGRDGPVADREFPAPYGELSPYASANTLDDNTDRVDSLSYFSNFVPSVIPYKRVVAKNHATSRNGQYSVAVQGGQLQQVAVSSAAPSDEYFWGSFLLRLERGRPHPIASVAPDQRIVEWAAEPDIPLEFLRDAADNYFASSSYDGLVRLNMRVAVSPFFFGGPFPEVGWDEFPQGLVPAMEPSTATRVQALAARLGFSREQPPAQLMLRMVEYFRDFDARPFPPELLGGDLLEAICTAEIGVCRHRSLAFVFLTQSLGIPSRYVYNEAHAFVEVYWPIGGWRRLELGGAANELNALASDGRPLHNFDDQLPEPPRFLEEQARMQHNGWEPPGRGGGEAESSDAESSQAESGDAEFGEATHSAAGHEGEAVDGAATDGQPVEYGEPPPQSLSADSTSRAEEVSDPRAATTLTITRATSTVRRGQSIEIEARLLSNGQPLAGQVIDVYLGAVGSTDPRSARKLGSARTDAQGRLITRGQVPPEHAIGRWTLFLHFAGDHSHQSAFAD